MAEATDEQMQTFANLRVRVRAEQLRDLLNACQDDKASNASVHARASGASPWNDSRDDGPPKMLVSQDMLTHDTIVTKLIELFDGNETGTEQEIANQRAAIVWELRNNKAAFLTACVRPVGG